MKYQSLLLFLLVILLTSPSCKPEYNGTKNGFENIHEYPSDNPINRENHPADKGMYDSVNRWLWQKPELVIDQLGDLTDKTVVDIGAGPYGYFSLRIVVQTNVKKVIAADIDEEVLKFLNGAKKHLPENTRNRLEPRLVKADDPMLSEGEADVVMIVNTSIYFENRVEYFKNVRKGIAPGGKMVIIDFKKRNTPYGPSVNERISLGQIEQELQEAGYRQIISDDRTLDNQYIVVAINE